MRSFRERGQETAPGQSPRRQACLRGESGIRIISADYLDRGPCRALRRERAPPNAKLILAAKDFNGYETSTSSL